MTATVRSMLDISPVIEPLPVYTRREDADAVSIRSSAPSYVSHNPPPYAPPVDSLTSAVAAPAAATQRPTGLPYRRYAAGFTPRLSGPVGDVASHNYNTASWGSLRTSGAAKQYENVARRRVERDSAVAGLLSSMSLLTDGLGGSSNEQDRPVSPLEDAALVGEAAAAAARDARLYREKCVRGDKMLRDESRSWDFMLAQMADWEERDRSWAKFRDDMARGRRVKLAKRIGATATAPASTSPAATKRWSLFG